MPRVKKKPPPDNELRWLTTYGDVVTLLLAFFVMLYAISQVDVQKFQLFVTGLADPFGNPSISNGLLTDGSALVGSANATAGDNTLEGVALLDGLPEVEEEMTEADLREGAEQPGDEPGDTEGQPGAEEEGPVEGIGTLENHCVAP